MINTVSAWQIKNQLWAILKLWYPRTKTYTLICSVSTEGVAAAVVASAVTVVGAVVDVSVPLCALIDADGRLTADTGCVAVPLIFELLPHFIHLHSNFLSGREILQFWIKLNIPSDPTTGKVISEEAMQLQHN